MDAFEEAFADASIAGRLGHFLVVVGVEYPHTRRFAERLARIALCQGKERRPCDTCVSCSVSLTLNPDYFFRSGIEADGLGIDDAKEFTRFGSMHSMLGGWRVVLIEGADHLNSSAANALLKTLEEPAPQTMFLFSAHTRSRLPETIRSRAMFFRLPLVARDSGEQASPDTTEDIVEKLNAYPSGQALDTVLSDWQRALQVRLRATLDGAASTPRVLGDIASLWKHIAEARKRVHANVNPRLIVESLLARSYA